MIVSITGGTGFIGKILVEKHLKRGDQVRVLTRRAQSVNPNVRIFIGNLISPDIDLSEFLKNTDILYHCAGEIQDKSLMKELHINGTKRLIDSARGNIGRIVQLSSVGAYGKFRNGLINEDTDENPFGHYEITKTASDDIVKNSGIPFVILRPSGVFGESMKNESLFKFIEIIKKGLFFYFGNKSALVNYTHVDDVVLALLECGEQINAVGNIFIISQTITVQKMVESFLTGLEINKKIIQIPEWIVRLAVRVLSRFHLNPLTSSRIDALTGHCKYDSSKITNKLQFEFSKSLEEHLILFAKQK
jgi:nucleoside-diphosphate-sugar epimerase